MKVMICGKGGSGKSTVTVLLARALRAAGKSVLVVDADESNLCLHRLLGASLPAAVLESMGGRQGAKQQLQPSMPPQEALLADPLTIASLPPSCLAEVDGVKLLVVGKIQAYGEGCACMVGSISKNILSRLREDQGEVVLVDAEAGLEHFGRRIDAFCDLVLAVVDPSYESLAMAGRIADLAREAGLETFAVLNKVEADVEATMREALSGQSIVAAIARSQVMFTDSLHGRRLSGEADLVALCQLLDTYRRPQPPVGTLSATGIASLMAKSPSLS